MSGTNNATNTPRLTTNGQLMIGSTGTTPAAATLTAGSNVTITNGAGTITIAATSGGGTSIGAIYPIIIAQFSN